VWLLGSQTALGLQAAHAKGLVHRDIKPQNVMLGQDAETGKVVLKVIDFGLAADHLISRRPASCVAGPSAMLRRSMDERR